jgi:hypothetical protein
MAIEKFVEKGNEAFIFYDCKTKNGGNSRNTEFFTIGENKIQDTRDTRYKKSRFILALP